MFINFYCDGEKMNYIYRANHISSIQREYESNIIHIQFDSGIVQHYKFTNSTEAFIVYKEILEQLKTMKEVLV